ncbi:extracellular solute-binding protein, family 3 [Oleiphilus messinensis]|uniref:Extracellular solute-binding protein, family 3 n=1 Tax=Oleiphilus messinensis TaxID=141451 RepID=A0A1Y0I7H5_9GAMM|nr:transporter substrate-binding domain-containing protein [Oleiphilus messinensis]ARU56448.1 extracellular solute-binding protein, family 3 [Oleiphilus messinensis]
MNINYVALAALFSLFMSIRGIAAPLSICIVDIEKWGEEDKLTGEIKGVYPDLFNVFQKRSGVEAIRRLAPYPRVIESLNSGVCDISITLIATGSNDIQTGSELYTIRRGVISARDLPITQYNQMRGLRVGVIRHAAVTAQFDNDKNIEKLGSVKYRNLLNMLSLGRIDAVAGDIDIMYAIVETEPNLAPFAEPLVLSELPINFMMSRKSAYLVRFAEFDELFLRLKEEGVVRKIVHEWLDTED